MSIKNVCIDDFLKKRKIQRIEKERNIIKKHYSKTKPESELCKYTTVHETNKGAFTFEDLKQALKIQKEIIGGKKCKAENSCRLHAYKGDNCFLHDMIADKTELVLLSGAKEIVCYISEKLKCQLSERRFYEWQDAVKLPMIKFNHSKQGKISSTNALVDNWLLDVFLKIYLGNKQAKKGEYFNGLEAHFETLNNQYTSQGRTRF